MPVHLEPQIEKESTSPVQFEAHPSESGLTTPLAIHRLFPFIDHGIGLHGAAGQTLLTILDPNMEAIGLGQRDDIGANHLASHVNRLRCLDSIGNLPANCRWCGRRDSNPHGIAPNGF